jgi:lipopolysaccharide exporter
MSDTIISRLPARLRLSGSSAIALSTIGTNLVRIVSTMCLTRLLSPSVYGITGLIMSVFYMINMVSDIGLQAYVVRHHRSDEPHFLDSVFTIHAVRGVILAAVAMILAWPLSLVLDKPQLFAPLAVSALIFVIDGQVSLHQFRGLRDGQIQRFAMIDLITGVSQTAFAIAFAFIFRNVWAIVASMLVGSCIRAWATYALFPGGRHSFRRDREVAADLWRFSRVIAVSSALTLVISQVDKLAMARILPLSQFGTYVIAASLAGAPTVFAFNYASSIVYPSIAAAWRDGSSIADSYYRSRGRFFYLYAFGSGGLIGGADLLVRFLYDPRYLASGTYLSILAISTSLMMVTRSMEAVQVAIGRPRFAIELNTIRLVWLVAGGGFALARSSPMLFVLTIGLVECPAYLFGLFRLQNMHVIRWSRELSALVTIGAGLAIGMAASAAGRILLPNL